MYLNMTGLMKNNLIINYFDEVIPNPKCELIFNNDYELLIAVMLSSQTTDKRVNSVTKILFKEYNNLEALARADLYDIIAIIKPIGTFYKKANNVIKISQKLLEVGGIVPNDRTFLESLPGVGRKTTNVVLSMLYNEPYLAVDTHVTRVSKRLGLVNKNDSVLEIEKKLSKRFKKYNLLRLHHQFILFGRYHCMAIHPLCDNCKLKGICKEKKNG